MKETFVGHRFQLLYSKITGIVLSLSCWASESNIPKYSASFDNEAKVERITKDNISLGEKVSDIDFFDRLIRDIQSTEEITREFASEILCDFLEDKIEVFDLETINSRIEKVIDQIKIENNINVEHKLVEGLFEFIWHEKLSKKAEIDLLERLIEIDSYYTWSYLESQLEDDLENLNSTKLNKYYIENKPKWDEKNDSIYGKKTRG